MTNPQQQRFIRAKTCALFRNIGRAMFQAVSGCLLPRKPWFYPSTVHVGCVVDKMTLGEVFSEQLGFPVAASLHSCFIIIHSSIAKITLL